jgi:Flp pilus assembly protein TadG
LVKIVLGIALVGLAAVELGSPIVMRAQLDGVAHDAADAAELELQSRGDQEAAKAEAVRVAEENDATLEAFSIEQQGSIKVTVRKEARSFVLKKWSRTESWYDVKVSVTSEPAK